MKRTTKKDCDEMKQNTNHQKREKNKELCIHLYTHTGAPSLASTFKSNTHTQRQTLIITVRKKKHQV